MTQLLCRPNTLALRQQRRSTRHVALAVGAAGAFLLALLGPRPSAVLAAEGLTPQSPEVKAAVARAVQYLSAFSSSSETLGGRCLLALALIKANQPATHPRIDEAVQLAIKAGDNGDPGVDTDNYQAALPIILLASVDAQKYRPEITKLLEKLLKQQKQNGSWGYDHSRQGDVPRTQYAVLALWEASHAEAEIPISAWENVTNFLLRVQDPSGGYGYQAMDPKGDALVPQLDLTVTRTAAGVGSLYICQDYLRLGAQGGGSNISTALRRVQEDKKKPHAGPRTQNVSVARLDDTEQRGDAWFEQNYSAQPDSEPHGYTCYYLYALERYQSFRELYRSSSSARSANWYDEGARYLLSSQVKDGSWAGKSSHLSTMHDTALATLFLVRSTQQALNRIGSGTLVGGRGLPQTTTDVQLKGGRVAARAMSGPAEQLLTLMGDPSSPDQLAAIEGFRELLNEGHEEVINKHAERLRAMAGAEDPEARIAAVEALARTTELDNVPTLIYALTDPDDRVVVKAVDGLRRISRKFSGFRAQEGLSSAERGALVARWKEWYLTVRPDANFEE
ncbi:MAG: HEAT repeat domain-containing protein [Pirellulales bacterium]|nr:HEAT repeat domain-containing protein [Pirellulales bacterium]